MFGQEAASVAAGEAEGGIAAYYTAVYKGFRCKVVSPEIETTT